MQYKEHNDESDDVKEEVTLIVAIVLKNTQACGNAGQLGIRWARCNNIK